MTATGPRRADSPSGDSANHERSRRDGHHNGGHPPTRPYNRRWPASVAVALVLVLQLAIPPQITAVPRWLLPACIAALLIPLVIANPRRLERDRQWLRMLAITLAAVLVGVNTFNLLGLVRFLVSGQAHNGKTLVAAAALIWVVNVVAFAVWFWEIDRDGPFARHPERRRVATSPDFLFPQMSGGVPGCHPDVWLPSFTDYVFVAFTNATAFSPTDTLPLSGRAKILMMIEAGISLLVVAVVAARAVNVL